MKLKSFDELLAGATPGEWRRYDYHPLGEDDVFAHAVCTPEDKSGSSVQIARINDIQPFTESNAEYIARLSPATMKEVWEALNMTRSFVECGEQAAGHKFQTGDRIRRAQSLLNGEKPENTP